MPGVTKDRLKVNADRNELMVEGDASIDMPEGMEAAYAEIRSARYRRSFTLTNELDTERDPGLDEGRCAHDPHSEAGRAEAAADSNPGDLSSLHAAGSSAGGAANGAAGDAPQTACLRARHS